jgi:ACR3 family arsenite transporter
VTDPNWDATASRQSPTADSAEPGGWPTAADDHDAAATSRIGRAVDFGERHQVAVYLLALACAVLLGLVAPSTGPTLEHAIEPVLATLLYATFLQVPFTALTRSFRDGRFLAAVLVVNFLLVPIIVWGLTLLLPDDRAVLLGVLLVLLTPCIDYVIVFAGLAGGSAQRLLAAAPLLMLAQMALLPLYLLLFLGSDLAAIVDPGPFVEAFVVLIAIPLTLALGTELLAKRHRAGLVITRVMTAHGALDGRHAVHRRGLPGPAGPRQPWNRRPGHPDLRGVSGDHGRGGSAGDPGVPSGRSRRPGTDLQRCDPELSRGASPGASAARAVRNRRCRCRQPDPCRAGRHGCIRAGHPPSTAGSTGSRRKQRGMTLAAQQCPDPATDTSAAP